MKKLIALLLICALTLCACAGEASAKKGLDADEFKAFMIENADFLGMNADEAPIDEQVEYYAASAAYVYDTSEELIKKAEEYGESYYIYYEDIIDKDDSLKSSSEKAFADNVRRRSEEKGVTTADYLKEYCTFGACNILGMAYYAANEYEGKERYKELEKKLNETDDIREIASMEEEYYNVCENVSNDFMALLEEKYM